MLNHIIQPSTKFINKSIFVFSETSVPAWEHKSNKNAGRWIIVFNDNPNLHNIWNNMVCLIIINSFENFARIHNDKIIDNYFLYILIENQ